MRILTVPRQLWLMAQLGLIFFSSTPVAGEASEYAFRYYRPLLGLGLPTPGLHALAQKSIHFLLFFALGTGLYNGLNVNRPRKVWGPLLFCFLVGIGSEGIQLLFPTRHASLADVVLNGVSSTLAIVLSLSLATGRNRSMGREGDRSTITACK